MSAGANRSRPISHTPPTLDEQKKDPDYKAPYNTLFNIPRVFTPDDKAIQTPNSDTPYSWIGLDLRAELIVFTVPPIARERDCSLQLIDLYTHNAGPRTSRYQTFDFGGQLRSS